MKKVFIIGVFNGIRVDSGDNLIDITPNFKNEEMRISQHNNIVKKISNGSGKFTEVKKEK